MAMHNPPHPGEVIREEILKPLGLSMPEAARHLGVSRQTLAKVLEENDAVTPEIAYRLSLLFKPSAESWLRQQADFDLWQIRRHATNIHVMPVAGVTPCLGTTPHADALSKPFKSKEPLQTAGH